MKSPPIWLVLVSAAAVVLPSMANAVPTFAKFKVTFSASQTSTVAYSQCGATGTTARATVSSTAPITATLRGTVLTITPNLNPNSSGVFAPQPLRMTATITKVDCPGQSVAATCGPTTGTIKPGLKELTVGAGQLNVRYQSGFQFFPSDTGSCGSGIFEMGASYPDPTGGTTPFDPSDLLKKTETAVTGRWTHDWTSPGGSNSAVEHTVVKFAVRFVRLP
jgi:hypothetical protein